MMVKRDHCGYFDVCFMSHTTTIDGEFKSSYIGAICNDGSVASYYVEQGDYTAGQTIMVYLEVSFQVMLGWERAK